MGNEFDGNSIGGAPMTAADNSGLSAKTGTGKNVEAKPTFGVGICPIGQH
ncbi:MAG TPA: hypothetical protein VGF89_09855 [Steroidobacteraceae bacterium]|jgi:hypothetical protein